MPHANAINPRTGKRFDFVDPAHQPSDVTLLKSQIRLLERADVALRARDSLLTYTRFTMPDPEAPNDVTKSRYETKEFHVAVADALERVERGEIIQLILCEPPRHGKTELATKRMAAWCSGRHPDWDVAVASYSDDMAGDMGGDTRAILTSPQHKQVFPKYKLRRGGNAKDNIQTVEGGRLVFVGRGGALTGRGMHIGLGDDLFKDDQEARSQATRDAAWNWFTKVFMTRRMGLKLVILTMTRWHSDDVIGRLTDPNNPYYNAIEAKKWKIINLPALAEENDPLGREIGEPLWPEKYDKEFLESQQRLDPLGFAALYQQRPSVADGTLFLRENIKYYTPEQLPTDLRIYCASDHAVGLKQRNDPSCLLTVGIDKQFNIYLLDCYWRRQPTDRVVEAMLDMASDRRPLLWWAGKDHISKSIGPFLRKRMSERNIWINLREVTPIGDKQTRAQSIAGRVAMGKVFWPKSANWTARSVDELLSFPNGLHDDFVDTLALIGLGLQSQFKPGSLIGHNGGPSLEEPKYGSVAWLRMNDKWAKDRELERRVGGF